MISLRAEISMNVNKAQAAMARFDKSVRRFDRDVGAPLRRATGNLGRFTATAALMGVTLAGAGLKIAGTFDQVNIRLRTVMGTVEQANVAFKETFDLFVRSPQYLMPLVEARTLLESFGVGGAAELRSVADAAAIMGRDVRHVALALGSMETRPLRRLGIDAHKAGESFTFNFQNKAGKALKVTARGLEQARRAVLKILNIKFGGGLEEMAKTWTGAMSTFIGASQAVIHKAMGPLKDALIPILMGINNRLITLATEGGSNLDLVGTKIRDFVMPSVNWINRLITAFNGLSEANRAQLTNLLKVSAGFVIAYKAGFVTPLLKMFTMLVTGQAAFLIPMLQSIAVIGAAKVGWEAGQMLLDGLTKPGSRSHIDSFAKFMAEPFKKAFDPKEWLPPSVAAFLENLKLDAPIDLPGITKSGTFAAQLKDAAEAAGALNGLMNLRGALAGTLPDIMPEPDRAMQIQFDRAAALEGQQRITNSLLGEAVVFLRTMAETAPTQVSFATP